jgi:hypothetical protein
MLTFNIFFWQRLKQAAYLVSLENQVSQREEAQQAEDERYKNEYEVSSSKVPYCRY